MAKDAFDRFWEWADKAADSLITIPAYLHQSVMHLQSKQRFDRTAVNEAARLADPDAQR